MVNRFKKDKKRIFVLGLIIFLFLYGFEYELLYFYNENASLSDYIIAVKACFLLSIYILPFIYILFKFIKKIDFDKNSLLISLACGMFVPGFLSAYMNEYGYSLIESYTSESFASAWATSLTAPINEEFIKLFLVLSLAYLFSKKSLKDYFIIGICVGLGFQIMEDISYVASDGLANIGDIIPLVFSRISGALASHWTYTALFSLAFYLLKSRLNKKDGYYLLISVFLNHFFWDSPFAANEFVPALLGTIILLQFYFTMKKYEKFLFEEKISLI